jgi:hypothetical protein
MCYSALDYYHVPQPVPDVSNVDEIPLKLFLHLWDRQLVSLGQDTVVRVFQWMILDEKTLGKTINPNEIPKLKNLLKAGSPAVLVLVRAKVGENPTNNHQVVAVGYDYDTDTKQMTIHLYDPNHPGENPDLTMNLAKPAQGISLVQSTGEALRGFFVLDYQPEPIK